MACMLFPESDRPRCGLVNEYWKEQNRWPSSLRTINKTPFNITRTRKVILIQYFVWIYCIGDGEFRRRGKRRRKGRQGGSDRLTSAGLAAHTQQDPETQVFIYIFLMKLLLHRLNFFRLSIACHNTAGRAAE